MSLLERLKEAFRPELPVQDEIAAREMKFNQQDSWRREWVLGHVYLCPGNLEELRKHPDYHPFGGGNPFTFYAAPQGKSGPCKPVRMAFPTTNGGKATLNDIKEAENSLKLGLSVRDANAGVFYRNYQKRGMLYVEAVPATITILE